MRILASPAINSTKQRKSPKLKLRKPRKSSWTIPEQTLYVQYLKKNAHLMKSQRSRRANQVFKKISMVVGTRTAVQAKTHHQKLEEKYQNTSNIIYHVELLIKKNALAQGQRQEEEAERARDEVSSTYVMAEEEKAEEQRRVPIDPELLEDPFFEYQSEKYEPLVWDFVIDCNEPLL